MSTSTYTSYTQAQNILDNVARKAIAGDYHVRIVVIRRTGYGDVTYVHTIHVSQLGDFVRYPEQEVGEWVYDNYPEIPANCLSFSFVSVY